MGNAQPITLGIKIDGYEGDGRQAPIANAGECLSGLVFADVPSSSKAQRLILELRGEEIAKTKHHGSRTFVQRPVITLQLELRAFPRQKINSGKYEFPFSVDLPASLPSSMRMIRSSASWCEVKYVIRALLVGAKAGKNIISERILFMNMAPLPPLKCPCMIEPVTKEVKNAVGFSKGSITFGVSVVNTHITRDEEIELRLACRNNATVAIKRVQAKVKEIVEWKVNDCIEEHEESILAEPNIIPGAEGFGRTSRTELKKNKKSGVDPQQDNYLDIFGEITSSSDQTNLVKLKIETKSRDTFKGKIINVKHLLVIKIKTHWGVDDPKIEIPLKVGSRSVAIAELPSERLPPPVPLPAPSEQETPLPIPVPVALPVGWSGAEQSLRIIAPPESIVIGGSVRDLTEAQLDNEEPIPIPVAIPSPAPSLEFLFSEMTSSVNDYDIISAKLQDSDWKQLFKSLTPEDFGSIIIHVNQEFDETRIAALIAPEVTSGAGFSCDHCAAAVCSCAMWNRAAMVQALLPFCIDIASKRSVIESELTRWEKVVTASDFDSAEKAYSGA